MDVQPLQPSANYSHSAFRIPQSPIRDAFTLIDLLVVISIAVVLAALLITAGGSVVQHSNLQRATSERDQLETAIEAYHSKYGFYPPDNGGGNAVTNQLYYELLGTTLGVSSGLTNFTTLDGASQINASAVLSSFGVSSFMNCTKGSGEDAVPAQNFLGGVLKGGEIASNGVWDVIVTAANSDAGYTPMPGIHSLSGRPANPWRYIYPGTNNPSSYDLWVQVFVGGKTNLICNWAKQPLKNVPLP